MMLILSLKQCCTTLFLVLLLSTCAQASSAQNKSRAIEYMQALQQGSDVPAAFQRFIGQTFVHHSPQMPEGREHIMQFLVEATAKNRGSHWELKRAIAEGDLVFLHGKVTPKAGDQAPEFAIANVFRFDNKGKIVEEWAVLQAVPAESANHVGMF